MDNPSYYAIITAAVRYDRNLCANAKLLYAEITALCNKHGHCFAKNKYFAELYQVSKVSISKWVKQLIDYGYIKSDIKYKDGSKEILHRYLTLVNYPIKEKFKDNTTSINNTINKDKEKAKEVISLFNKITGKQLKQIKSNYNMIIPRLKDGFTVDDFRKVFTVKYNQWKDNRDMRQYIRLSTLTRASKFDDYLNEWNEPENKKKQTIQKDGIDMFNEWKKKQGAIK